MATTDARGHEIFVGDEVLLRCTVLEILPGGSKLKLETCAPSRESTQVVQLFIDAGTLDVFRRGPDGPAFAPPPVLTDEDRAERARLDRAEAALARGEDPAEAEAKFIAESDLTPAEKRAAAKRLKDATKA